MAEGEVGGEEQRGGERERERERAMGRVAIFLIFTFNTAVKMLINVTHLKNLQSNQKRIMILKKNSQMC